jgi:hypothetical protein
MMHTACSAAALLLLHKAYLHWVAMLATPSPGVAAVDKVHAASCVTRGSQQQ